MTSLAEIFGQVISLGFGDVGLALIVLLVGIAVILWVSNVPLGAMLIIGLPFLGAVVQAVTQDFVVTIFAMALATVGMVIWIAIGELSKKY